MLAARDVLGGADCIVVTDDLSGPDLGQAMRGYENARVTSSEGLELPVGEFDVVVMFASVAESFRWASRHMGSVPGELAVAVPPGGVTQPLDAEYGIVATSVELSDAGARVWLAPEGQGTVGLASVAKAVNAFFGGPAPVIGASASEGSGAGVPVAVASAEAPRAGGRLQELARRGKARIWAAVALAVVLAAIAGWVSGSWLVGVGALLVLAGLGWAWLFSRSVSARLREIETRLRTVASGSARLLTSSESVRVANQKIAQELKTLAARDAIALSTLLELADRKEDREA